MSSGWRDRRQLGLSLSSWTMTSPFCPTTPSPHTSSCSRSVCAGICVFMCVFFKYCLNMVSTTGSSSLPHWALNNYQIQTYIFVVENRLQCIVECVPKRTHSATHDWFLVTCPPPPSTITRQPFSVLSALDNSWMMSQPESQTLVKLINSNYRQIQWRLLKRLPIYFQP